MTKVQDGGSTLTTFSLAARMFKNEGAISMCRKSTALVLIMALAGVLFAPGCATVGGSTTQRIPVTSFPRGARVSVNGVERGLTPLELRLSKGGKGRVIRIESPGYNPVEIRLAKKTSGVPFLANVFLGLIPGIAPTAVYSLATEGKGGLAIWILSAAAFGALFTVVDNASGAAVTFEPREITVTLKKASGPPRIDTILLDPDELRNIKWIRVHRD